jgi:glutamate/tyrosine decarboxylase-like PLP-dependent enzyme
VIGGSLDAATAADVLTTGWDQCAVNATNAPAAAVVEDIAGGWLKELLRLPAAASFGFVTGAQGANTVALAAARHHVLAEAGWAFGLWAAANPATRHLVGGVETADSWATDGHKWLNVPYDCGYVFCAHPDAHAAAMSYTAAYLSGQGEGGFRAPADYVPESSRRARGFATWAALRQLGRNGVAELVERCCALARRFAAQLSELDGATVVNDVVLNQVLVRFGGDAETDRVIDAVQRSGECWMGGTTWHGMRLMRISVSSWRTTEADVDRSVAAISAAMAGRART